MLEKLKERIGYFLLNRQIGKENYPEAAFNNFIASSDTFLLIYPKEPVEYKLANEVSNHLVSIGKIVAICLPEHKVNELPGRNKLKFLTFTEFDISKLGLPKSTYKKELAAHNYDVVIDLNLAENLFASAVANYIESKFRIGFIKQYSDLYYNFQLPNQINNENSYRNLLNSFRMF